MDRRHFSKKLGLSLASAAGLLATAKADATNAAARATRATGSAHKLSASNLPHIPLSPQSNRKANALIKPAKLKRGDLVGLIAPSGVLDDATLQRAVTNVESLGFKVKLSANIRAVRGGYAGTVSERLDDLHAMFADRDVNAIWAARGGSGCSGLLPRIRYDLIRKNPKILIGYSDITALHLAIHRMTGLVTFHGPVAPSAPNDYALAQLAAVLMEPRLETEINMSVANNLRAAEKPEYTQRTVKPGMATGRLMGGNLSVLTALIGTPYEAQLKNNLVFLEDVSEPPYKIDRMLTQLDQQTNNALAHAAGVMLGVFSRSAAPGEDRTLTLDEVVDDHLKPLAVPSVYGFSFGHFTQQFTIPMGVMARLDTENKTLILLEAAVTG